MKKIDIANRMSQVHSDIRGPLFVEANRMIAEGTKVLKLNTGNPGTFGFGLPDSLKKAVVGQIDNATPYCDVRGMVPAREAIYNYHRSKGLTSFEMDDIYIGNGVSELVPMVLTALLNDGDEILLPTPDYSLWTNSILLSDGVPVYYNCVEENHWLPDLDDIRSKITPKTRAIVIINPNNPTGVLYPEETIQAMVDIAREHDLIVFSDEIYDRLVMDGKKHVSPAALAPDLFMVTFNGLSKSHIVCGFRAAWMVISGPKEGAQGFMNGIMQMAAMRLCANAIMQLAIPAALEDRASTEAMLVPGGRLYEQRQAVMDGIDKIDGLTCVRNDANFYCFPHLDAEKFHINDINKFALDYLHAKHVLVIPGKGFNWDKPDHFRIVMLPEAPVLAKAISDLGDFLADYRQY